MKIIQIEHVGKGIVFGLGDDNKLYIWNSQATEFQLFDLETAKAVNELIALVS